MQDGYCYGLFSKARCESLSSVGTSEISPSDLLDLCLVGKAQALQPRGQFFAQAPSPPSETAVRTAIQVLKNPGALTQDEEVTSLSIVLAALPLHQTNGKRLLMGVLFRCLDPMLILSAATPDDPFWSAPKLSSQELGKWRSLLQGL